MAYSVSHRRILNSPIGLNTLGSFLKARYMQLIFKLNFTFFKQSV